MKTNTLELTPGSLVVVPGFWGEKLSRIDQTRFDGFRLVFRENEPAISIELDTRGINRLPEEGPLVGDPPHPALLTNLDRIELKKWDVLTVTGLGTKEIVEICEVRERRFEVRLIEKYQRDVIIEVIS